MNRITVEERLILLALTGSQAYGTATATSDCDYKGVFIAPKDYYLGFKSVEQKDYGWATEPGTGDFPMLDGVKDCVVYELRKFLTLVSNNNPNIMEMLWLDDEFYSYVSPVGAHLLSYRELFVSQKIRGSFVGYAYAQIKRVENHRKWLLNPPSRKPVPQDFGLDDNDHKPLTKGEMNAFLEFLYMLVRDCIEFMEPSQELYELLTSRIDFKGILKQHPLSEAVLPKVQEYTRAKDDFIHLLHISQAYRAALNEWDAYCRWNQGRNPQRKALETKCGYDCYADDTEFLTNRGWLLYDDIQESDLLATVNPQTHRLEWQSPSDRAAYGCPDRLWLLENIYTCCLVTSNHKLFGSLLTRKPSNNYVRTYQGEPFSLIPINTLGDRGRKEMHIAVACAPTDRDYPVADEYLVALGTFVTEGCINREKGRLKALRVEQKEGGCLTYWLDYLLNYYRGSKYPITRVRAGMPDYSGHLWCISDLNLLKSLIADAKEGSYDKCLPLWTTELSFRQVSLLLDVMMAADGTVHGSGRVLYTVSEALASSVQTMCMACGMPSVIWGKFEGGKTAFKPHQMYHVYVPNQVGRIQAIKLGRHLKETSHTSRVVCFSVPNELLVTRRNGKVAIQGNSKHMAHCIRLLRMGIEVLKDGVFRVNRKKAGDADYLLSIRQGDVAYEAVKEAAEKLFQEIQGVSTTLPKQVDTEFLNSVCVELVEMASLH